MPESISASDVRSVMHRMRFKKSGDKDGIVVYLNRYITTQVVMFDLSRGEILKQDLIRALDYGGVDVDVFTAEFESM